MAFILLLFAILFSQAVSTPLSCQWTRGTEIGTLSDPIDEDSGLAISRKFQDRVYHVNDSGDSGRFFITTVSGKNTRIVKVNGFTPHDAEDLSIGPCGATDCLFIGDIGDNSKARRTIEIAVVEERENFPDKVDARYRVKLRYPDGPHDAESLAVHPNGTIYILTKGGMPLLYRLAKNQWMNANGQTQMLQVVAAFDLEKLGGAAAAIDGHMPTAMDISPDGKRILMLTYRNVFEFFFDLSQPLPPVADWKPGRNYRRIDVEVLDQQEGIAFTPDGRSFIYDTEKPSKGPARLMRSDCR